MATPRVDRPWIAGRMDAIRISGIRQAFELARTLPDPINLSIGSPDFDVPAPIRDAACSAIQAGANGYTITQGIASLRETLLASIRRDYPRQERSLIVTSGTSGALMLSLLAVVDPGDEVVLFDPYFVLYPNLVILAGGTPVFVDTYPDFHIDCARVEAVLSPRTKVVLFNSPANPTGAVASREEIRKLSQLCHDRGILLISDEIYRLFTHDEPFVSPAEFNDQVLVIDGFSKSHGMPGWRLGFAHGPPHLIEEMTKLQQFSFVCAPSMVQHAGVVACQTDMSDQVSAYRRKRDRIYEGIKDCYDLPPPGGAFYLFPRAPGGDGAAFVQRAAKEKLIVIAGSVFSRRDTHFRLSYSADERTLDRGIEVLRRLAR